MTWIQTHAGGKLDYADENWTALSIEEIAHSLSNTCRYNGHCNEFYSVAEHSVWVSFLVPNEYLLPALLHDASEAYVGDVPRPLKKFMGQLFADLEEKAAVAVGKKFDITPDLFHCHEVKRADNAMLWYETQRLMPKNPVWNQFHDKGLDGKIKIQCLKPEDAKRLFLNRYKQIISH